MTGLLAFLRIARMGVGCLAVSVLCAGTAHGGCLSLSGPVPASACAAVTPDLIWLNPPHNREVIKDPSSWSEPSLDDPAIHRGVTLRRDAEFKLRVAGKQFVEVFVLAADDSRGSFLLEADGEVVDSRYRKWTGGFRFKPRGHTRRFALLALVDGPVNLTVRTDVPEYLLSAVRWTPLAQFEETTVPRWLERARKLQARPLLHSDGVSPTSRGHWLQQLYDRLVLSGDEAVHREAVIGLARVWYWEAAENHEPRAIWLAGKYGVEAWKLAPDSAVVRQTLTAACARLNIGTTHPMPSGDFCSEVAPVPWDVELPDIPAGAPDWAVAQIRLARRMEAITRWWVEQRQAPDGELGGGWGDDVEILRHWGPQALGFGSAVASRGIENIADGIWSSGYIVDGYYRQLTDVEHSSEPTTDSQPLLAALHPDRAEVLDRLRQTRACADNWIAKQPDGHWRFRSSWFNCAEVDTSPKRAVDVHLNVRAMGPVLWYAYLSRDPGTVALLARWAESWVEAMRRTEHGKPAGILPSAQLSINGSYLVDSNRWDKPNAEWDYFQWSGRSQEALTSLLLALHDLTGEKKWLDAAGESFEVFAACDSHPELCAEIRKDPESFYEWRRRSGDSRYDAAFGYEPPAGDEAILALMTRQGRDTERYLSTNFDMLTSEVLFTDRVYYRWPAEYRHFLFGGEAPRGERYPTFAVTWPEADAEFARVVLESRADRLRLRLYSFSSETHEAPLRIWRLRPGAYRWVVRDQTGKELARAGFKIARLPETVSLRLPAHREVTVEITQARQSVNY